MNRDLLERDGAAPLYRRVREVLRERLSRGVWKPGEMLPTETELGNQLGVSPGTVRQAVLSLVREGLINRRPGKGTFVARLDGSRSLARFFRFREGESGERFEPEIRVASVEIVKQAPQAVVRHLGVRRNASVLKLRRVLMMDATPVCLYTSWLPHRLVAGLERRDLSADRLYHIIEQHSGIHVLHADELLRASAAAGEDAGLLGVGEGTPVILIERTAYTHNDIVVEWRQTIGRSDQFTYKIRLP